MYDFLEFIWKIVVFLLLYFFAAFIMINGILALFWITMKLWGVF